MNKRLKIIQIVSHGIFLILIFFIFGCSGQADLKVKPGKIAVYKGPRTLAVLPFENNSITDPLKYKPLSKGLAAMLMTDLGRGGNGLKLIERNKIESLLKEIALGQGGSVDSATAVRVGKILGARAIAFGSFVVLGEDVRIDLRIVKVETSELIVSESIVGKSADFMGLESRLANKITSAMNVAATGEPASGGDIDAAVNFSKGLDALDNGNRDRAKELFDKSPELDARYKEPAAEAEVKNK